MATSLSSVLPDGSAGARSLRSLRRNHRQRSECKLRNPFSKALVQSPLELERKNRTAWGRSLRVTPSSVLQEPDKTSRKQKPITRKVELTKQDKEELDVELPALDSATATRSAPADLVVVGAGPAGLAVADKASAKGLSVVVVDPAPRSLWPNNYGVWVDEFEELGLGDCFARTWDTARVVLGDGPHEHRLLNRPYAQVDRHKLKTKLLQRCADQGVQFRAGAVQGVAHEQAGQSEVALVGGKAVYGRAVLDATGHARRLVEFEKEFTPGYQAAFGVLVKVKEHPFPMDEMLFMDWRDSHLSEDSQARNRINPTFLYAMPYSPTLVFLEETSLVERPYVGFDELKDRLYQRVTHLGIEIEEVEEEEYCLIPMGGVLPTLPQRVLGIGGTAGMVHPSTGYMVSKTLKSAETLVDALDAALKSGKSGDAASISRAVWGQIWDEESKRMRTFYCFGMETLMGLDVGGVRRFFGTFFTLPQEVWGGFLSWRIKPAGLLALGLGLFRAFSNQMRVEFVLKALPFMPSFLKNFIAGSTDFSSEPWQAVSGVLGEKAKAVEMLREQQQEDPNPAAQPITGSATDFKALVERSSLASMRKLQTLGFIEPPKPDQTQD